MSKSGSYAKNIGSWGEQEAVNFLREQGVSIIDRNVRTDFGEIDILGMVDDVIIFFEVKTRLTEKFGFPEVAVDRTKAEHLVDSALDYLHNHPDEQHDWRIDVIAITKYRNQSLEIKWFKNAISK